MADARAAERYALDTEFHRERSYYPQLALVQLAWGDELVLVDPLAVDIRELVPLFVGPGLAVLHAAQQDLDVLTHACGAVPAAAGRHAARRRLSRAVDAVAVVAADRASSSSASPRPTG